MSCRGMVTKRLRESYMKREGLVSIPAASPPPSKIQPKKEESESLPVGAVPQKAKRVVKPKKVYALPGQKKDTPPENDALRKFYTSLRSQRQESELAIKWCVEHGLETREFAEEWIQRQTTRKTSASASAGSKSARGASQNPGTPKPAQKRAPKRKVRSAEDALPPKEISRAPKTAKFTKPSAQKSNPAAEAKPSKVKKDSEKPMTKTRTQRVQPKKEEESTLPTGIEGEAWESSSDDEDPRSRTKAAS